LSALAKLRVWDWLPLLVGALIGSAVARAVDDNAIVQAAIIAVVVVVVGIASQLIARVMGVEIGGRDRRRAPRSRGRSTD